jgi:hypothetical protein
MKIKTYLHMMKNLILCLFCCASVLSCINDENNLSPLDSRAVCQLDENLTLLDAPRTLSIIDKDNFVITAGDNIIVYGFDGKQKSFFNRKGRGQFEYQMLSYVRGCDNRIYAWDAGSCKFIEYDESGNGVKEYLYKSAISDFLPYGDKLYIYNSGKRSKYVVDVFDLRLGIVADSLVNTTPSHRLLLTNESSKPMAIKDDALYFMPRDAMDIYKYSFDNKEVEKVRSVESKTFKVESVADDGIVGSDFMKAVKYLFSSSYTLALGVGRHNYTVLTSEGKAEVDNRLQVSNNELTANYYVIGNKVKEFSSERNFDIRLAASFSGDIYFIDHSVEEDNDCYTLKVLKN